jgi:hypothetical protein
MLGPMTDLAPATPIKRAFARLRLPTVASGERGWRLFVWLIVVTTLVPYAVMPLSVHFGQNVNELLLASTLLNFLGGHVHVSTTAFFYSDPGMREHFRAHKVRYVYAPIALILGVGFLYMITPEPYNRYILLYHFMWQTWHYQRQNFGILAFVSSATASVSGRVPVSRFEKLALDLAAVAGMLALITINALNAETILAPFTDAIYLIACVAYAAVPVVIAIAVFQEPRLLGNRLRIGALLLFSAFYLPSFIFTDPISAVLGYALGHGLQYLVFMTYVGASRPRPLLALGALIGLGIGGGFLLTYMTNAGSEPGALFRFIFGMAVGTVMSHFVIDAGVWKLRHPFQRGYMRAAFPFIFDRRPTS